MSAIPVALLAVDNEPARELVAAWLAQPRIGDYLGPPYLQGTYTANHIGYAIRVGRSRFYLIEAGGRPVGFIGFSEICAHSRKADFFGALGEVDLAYKGVMLQATGLAAVRGFEELSLHSMYSRVMAHNYPIMKGLLHHGFTRFGIHKEAFNFRGEFVDIHLFQLLRSEWEKRGRESS